MLILSGFKVLGQTQSNLRSKILYLNRDTIPLDSLLILPGTVKVYQQNELVNKDWYQINVGKGSFIPSQELKEKGESIKIEYRVFDYNIKQPKYNRDLSQLKLSGSNRPNTFAISPSHKSRDVFSGDQLEKQGNYTRGISYGNNQDVVVNSNLNLQLSGKLTNEVSILAAISDNNIPIQPDGNTQTINDFDRIYIQLYDDTKELTLGDYELQSPTGKFMRFYKKVQGGKFSGLLAKGKKSKTELKSTISASIAKGKFNRMELQGSEGIQGPYRLIGANNESYIIVLAGTEKVFVDGKLLSRGEQNDYVINYNTAELSFTTKQPITRNSRIIIEFEYSEENYSRYLLFNSNELKTRTGKFWFNFYHEQDSKNQSIDQSLSDENKLLLSTIGDKLELAKVANIEEVEYSNDFVLYKKIKRSIENVEYEIYQYSTNVDSAIYRATFSYAGINKGNYQLANGVANGRVYQWMDPVNGVPQGEFEPIVQLVAPQKQQLYSFGGDVNLSENLNSKFELALSNRDLNTFSSIDDSNNQGIAFDFSMRKNMPFADTLKHLETTLDFHHIQKNFSEIEPFRSAEFIRDWNLQDDFTDANENFYSLSNIFSNQNWGQAGYEFSILKKDSDYQGNNHALNLQFAKKRVSINFTGNSLSTDQENVETKFYRHLLNTSYALGFAKIGLQTENENNQWKNKNSRDLLQNSASFYSYKAYISNRDSSNNQFQAYYQKRKDLLPFERDLKAQSESQDFGAQIWLKKNRNNQLKLETVYRKLSILDDSYTDEKPENTFLGKLEHQARIKKGLLQTSTYYELGSGLESEKEFSFVEVNEGQGIYRWTDYNANEVKEINEFEVASFKDEANYIRVSTNTTNYQKVFTSEFRQTFYLRLAQLKAKGDLISFLKRFSNRFAYRISKKSLKNDFDLYANPFLAHASNENLITINSSFQNTLSYRKPKSKTNWDLIHLSSNGKQLLTQGFERRKFMQNGFRFQWKIGDSNQLSNRIDLGEKNLNNESFTDKNYSLQEIKNELKLQFQPTLNFQFGLSYTYNSKENDLATEKSSTHNIGADCQYSLVKTGKLMATVNFLMVDFNAESNSSIAYEMLEGFLPGNNTTWSLGYNQQLSNIFQLSVSYNGRNSEGGKTIHVGSMEVRAYF
ncbi:hypothetical protein BZG02_11330 [Labilibaculum filiforme]|uniref:Uncharacterized protein n=1 Tax=Labilibaculum filiforme TaxID=1940526 RepID=A0A2N3HXK1_9BACT|nr:hypothetical protein BZG02_11330 [Labilibaculum filiforme]